MMPPAPGRLSTMTCWPAPSLNFAAMMRATMLGCPPGVKPMTMRMGRFGNVATASRSCAAGAGAVDVAAYAPSASSAMRDVRAISVYLRPGDLDCLSPFGYFGNDERLEPLGRAALHRNAIGLESRACLRHLKDTGDVRIQARDYRRRGASGDQHAVPRACVKIA